MRRGTTPTITVEVDKNLSGWKCYVTIKGAARLLTISGDRLSMDVSGNKTTIAFTLTQQETLSFVTGTAKIQLRAIMNGTAIATDIQTIEVHQVLQEVVIE